jgi:hypothetical protein
VVKPSSDAPTSPVDGEAPEQSGMEGTALTEEDCAILVLESLAGPPEALLGGERHAAILLLMRSPG